LNPEILKLTNAKTVRLDGVGGGKPELTREMLLAACAGCDEIGLTTLLMRICGDRSRQGPFYYKLYVAAMGLALRNHWKMRDKGQEKIRSLMHLVVYEITSPPVCPKCGGTKYNRLMRPCKSCKGTGVYKIRDSHRARALGINQSTWGRVWQDRYNQLYDLVSDKEYAALRIISRKLRDDV